jgi:NAD/NADP transhydrogenase beta subunit
VQLRYWIARAPWKATLILALVGAVVMFWGSGIAAGGLCGRTSCTDASPLVGYALFCLGAVIVLAAVCLAIRTIVKRNRRNPAS